MLVGEPHYGVLIQKIRVTMTTTIMISPSVYTVIFLMVVALNYFDRVSLKIRASHLSINSLTDLTNAAPTCPSIVQPIKLRHDEKQRKITTPATTLMNTVLSSLTK
jgi:hypothetical protein